MTRVFVSLDPRKMQRCSIRDYAKKRKEKRTRQTDICFPICPEGAASSLSQRYEANV
jgi:hypothetical protein